MNTVKKSTFSLLFILRKSKLLKNGEAPICLRITVQGQVADMAIDYYMRLTNFYSQFRSIGVNYNQVVKHLKGTFTEKKALAFLYKLEKATIELVGINQKIINLTEEFEKKYLDK